MPRMTTPDATSRVTVPLRDHREARTPLEEGLSLVPYFWLNQRLHRKRWTQGLTAAAAIAGLAVLARLRRR